MPALEESAGSNGIASPRVSEERLEELLDVAAEVFFERGFEAASVGEMARRAKASKGTYYSRFATKSALFEAIIKRRSDQVFGQFHETLVSSEPIAETLRRFSTQLLDLILSDESIALVRLLYMEARNFPELGKSFYQHGIGRIRRAFVEFLERQVCTKPLKHADLTIIADQFLDGLAGELTRRLALGLGPLPARKELNRRIEIAVSGFLKAHCSENDQKKL